MALVSASLEDIEDNLVEYFANHFDDPPSSLTSETDVPTTYNLGADQWAAFADTISQLNWMVSLKVRLAQGEMSTVPKIGQLANLIWKRTKHLISSADELSEVYSIRQIAANPDLLKTPASSKKLPAKKAPRKSRRKIADK